MSFPQVRQQQCYYRPEQADEQWDYHALITYNLVRYW